jgi:hypothetical protein
MEVELKCFRTSSTVEEPCSSKKDRRPAPPRDWGPYRGGLGIAHAASDGSHGRALDSSEWALRNDAGGEAVCHTRKKNQVTAPVCTSGSDEIVENCVGFLLGYLGDVCAREINDVRYQILVFLGYFR